MSLADQANTIMRRSLHDELVDRLYELIVEGSLAPGNKVPERALCETFGVSRTPMREALKVLAAEGLVSLEPNRGAWVTQLSLAELEEVFPVMGVLEALSGELACQRITDSELRHIRNLHEQMEVHYESRNRPEYFQANQHIHEAILEAARNKTLAQQYRVLAARMRRARYLANTSDTRWEESLEEHREILKALEARDGDALARILKDHLANKFETIRVWLQDAEAGAAREAKRA